jgi:hypothetical protein
MKRILTLLSLLFAIASTAHAGTVTVLAPTYDNYGKGMVCVVDEGYNSQFEGVFQANDFATGHNDRNSALKLLGFFKDVDQNACYVPKGQTNSVPVPNRDVYVVTILIGDGGKVLWNITQLDGSFGGVVTVDEP